MYFRAHLPSHTPPAARVPARARAPLRRFEPYPVAPRDPRCCNYDDAGLLRSIAEPGGLLAEYEYDSEQRLIRVRRQGHIAVECRYDERDRLAARFDHGQASHFSYDAAGRVSRTTFAKRSWTSYSYDAAGRLHVGRTASVTTRYERNADGQITELSQSQDGVEQRVRFDYFENGLLRRQHFPGGSALEYGWDAWGRPSEVSVDGRTIARFVYDPETLDAQSRPTCGYFERCTTLLSNGLVHTRSRDAQTGLTLELSLSGQVGVLFRQQFRRGRHGELLDDGERRYRYDAQGRLTGVERVERADLMTEAEPIVEASSFEYDARDNRIREVDGRGRELCYTYGLDNELTSVERSPDPANRADGASLQRSYRYDRAGRLIQSVDASGARDYRYDDRGHLREALVRGESAAKLRYDHGGRVVFGEYPERRERYIYGPGGELLAISDAEGALQRIFVYTPFGLLAEICIAGGRRALYFRHADQLESTRLVSDEGGDVVASFAPSAFGVPLAVARRSDGPRFRPFFGGHPYFEELGLYDSTSRWYCADLGRFVTPDSYTGAPDDPRLIRPGVGSQDQRLRRSKLLSRWLAEPRVRNRYVYCANNPVDRVDPDGHWSAWVILSVLGAIWTLPNTLVGLALEVLCLVGEIVHLLVFLFSGGNAGWETPGFDAAASGRLDAFALVFTGGWFGSIPSLLGVTFGNVIFVYKKWEENPEVGGPGDVFPEAYNGQVAIPRRQALYEHQLRHVNQQTWFGPLFLFVYLIDLAASGGSCHSWLERDARKYSGVSP